VKIDGIYRLRVKLPPRASYLAKPGVFGNGSKPISVKQGAMSYLSVVIPLDHITTAGFMGRKPLCRRNRSV
jgi:hypothetical protein